MFCVDVTKETTFKPYFWKELFKDLKSSIISLDKSHLQMAALCLKPNNQSDGEIHVKLYSFLWYFPDDVKKWNLCPNFSCIKSQPGPMLTVTKISLPSMCACTSFCTTQFSKLNVAIVQDSSLPLSTFNGCHGV